MVKNVHIHLLKVLKAITEYQIITLVIVVEQDTLMIDFLNKKNDTESKSFKLFKENEYKKLAEIVEKNLDMKKIYEIMGLENEFDV